MEVPSGCSSVKAPLRSYQSVYRMAGPISQRQKVANNMTLHYLPVAKPQVVMTGTTGSTTEILTLDQCDKCELNFKTEKPDCEIECKKLKALLAHSGVNKTHVTEILPSWIQASLVKTG